MNSVWLIVALGLVAAVVAIVAAWGRGDRHSDLGAVSHQWISEHRLGQGHDPRG